MSPSCQATTVEHVERFQAYRDYDSSQFAVTISRVQQLALDHACGPVPLPSKQLELANAKKDKEPRAYLELCHLPSHFFGGVKQNQRFIFRQSVLDNWNIK